MTTPEQDKSLAVASVEREPTLCEHCEMEHAPVTACPMCVDPHDAMVLPGTWR